MKKEQDFYFCEKCGNLTASILDAGVPMVCCGEEMTLLTANTEDASTEKHVPVVSVVGNSVEVKVGSDEHPMIEKHYIQFIYLVTKEGGQIKHLAYTDEPKATFAINSDDEVLAVYEYCNLHGLWKTEL